MSVLKIKNLEEFMQQSIGADNSIKDYQITRLTAPGENYGSLMLKVDITITNSNKNEEKLYTVAKLIPEDPQAREIFQIQDTVEKEIAFYSIIVPLLQDLQREHGITEVINFFPKLYGGRLNLTKDSKVVDEDALLVFENLSIKGFRNIDRHIGFDLDGAKVILKDLAAFHAIPLALKTLKPKVFEEKVKKYFIKMEPKAPPPNPHEEENKQVILEICAENEESKPYKTQFEKLVAKISENPELLFKRPPVKDDKYATISHGDMWVNNTMQRLEENKIVDNKFVDFQTYYYDSATRDLHFFLWSSCQIGVLRNHIENLIKFYYDNFIENLKELDCDISSFSYENFMEEMAETAKTEFFHCLFFTIYVVFGKKRSTNEDSTEKPTFHLKKDELPQELVDRIVYLIYYFGNNNWLEQ